jgi:hypothetical protein
LRPLLRADDKQLIKPLNGRFYDANQDQDDDNGFFLFRCDIEQGLIATVTLFEGWWPKNE